MMPYDPPDDWLSLLLDGETSVEQRRELEERLRQNPAAQRRLEALRELRAALRGLPRGRAPVGLADAVRARLARGDRPGQANGAVDTPSVVAARTDRATEANRLRSAGRRYLPYAIAAGVLGAIGLTGWIVNSASGPRVREPLTFEAVQDSRGAGRTHEPPSAAIVPPAGAAAPGAGVPTPTVERGTERSAMVMLDRSVAQPDSHAYGDGAPNLAAEGRGGNGRPAGGGGGSESPAATEPAETGVLRLYCEDSRMLQPVVEEIRAQAASVSLVTVTQRAASISDGIAAVEKLGHSESASRPGEDAVEVCVQGTELQVAQLLANLSQSSLANANRVAYEADGRVVTSWDESARLACRQAGVPEPANAAMSLGFQVDRAADGADAAVRSPEAPQRDAPGRAESDRREPDTRQEVVGRETQAAQKGDASAKAPDARRPRARLGADDGGPPESQPRASRARRGSTGGAESGDGLADVARDVRAKDAATGQSAKGGADALTGTTTSMPARSRRLLITVQCAERQATRPASQRTAP